MGLNIYLLGQFNLQANELPIELPSRPAQSLLAYLALNAGVTQRREKLAGLLWPEATETNARSYLRQALWRIRKSLETGSQSWEEYLQISDISVTMDTHGDYWLDAETLQETAEPENVEELIRIVRHYKGELLPGFYDEWVLVERDRLQSVYHQKMHMLIQELTKRRRWDKLLQWGEEWIRLGYSPEPAYRALMKAYASLGDQGMVSVIYQRCVESLGRELGLDPSPKTRELHEQILRGEWEVSPEKPVREAARFERQPPFLDVCEQKVIEESIFVARERELDQLNSFLELTLNGQGRVVFVTGETGCGKTALVQEFTRLAQDDHHDLVVAGGNCNAQTGIGDPYLPFREILELLTGDVEARWDAGTISGEHARRLWNTLPLTAEAISVSSPNLIDTFIPGSALLDRAMAYAPTQQEWHSRLIEIVESRPASSLVSGTHQSDIFEQYSRVLAALARSEPLVLVVDDLQWADLGSISLLFHLGRQIKGNRILIVCAYRPEEVALGRGGERHPLVPVVNEFQREYGDSTVNVDAADSLSFVEDLLDSEPYDLSQDFRSMFYRFTHGNPLFSLELLRGMQERGDLLRDQYGTWVEGQALDWETLPARVEAVIAERIGRLDGSLRAALRVASVEGHEFTAEAVARIRSVDEREMLAKLSRELDRKHRLIRSQSILRIDGQLLSRYRFRHFLFQKYLYGSLDDVKRVYLHEQVGNVLEDLYQVQVERPTSDDLAPQLARHFQEARIIEKAVFYLSKVGERALQLSAYQEAVSHFDRVLTVLMTLPESPERAQQELSVQLALGMAWQGIEGPRHPAVIKAYTRAYELCQQTGETTQIGRMQGEMLEFYYVGAEYLTARDLAREALTLAQQEKNPLLEAMAHWYLGFVHFALGEFAMSRDYLAQVISFYEPQTHHHPFIVLRGKDAGLGALAYDACCLWCLGYPDQAHRRSQESLALARELGQPFSMVDVLTFGGCVSNEMRRDWGALKEYAERIVQLTADQVPGWRGTGEIYLGEALVMMGKIPEGIEQIREGLATRQTVEALCYGTGALGILAVAEGTIGNPGRGLSTLTKAIALVEQMEERYCEAELYRLQGNMHLMMGDEDEAFGSFMKAIDVARRQNARSWELRAGTSLARLWRKQGKISEAHELLKPVYDWFTEGFETPDLIDAKTLLEELSIVGQY